MSNINAPSDAEAIQSDWEAVGHDLVAARQAVLREQKKNNA